MSFCPSGRSATLPHTNWVESARPTRRDRVSVAGLLSEDTACRANGYAVEPRIEE